MGGWVGGWVAYLGSNDGFPGREVEPCLSYIQVGGWVGGWVGGMIYLGSNDGFPGREVALKGGEGRKAAPPR